LDNEEYWRALVLKEIARAEGAFERIGIVDLEPDEGIIHIYLIRMMGSIR
jgi:hypothetical protein